MTARTVQKGGPCHRAPYSRDALRRCSPPLLFNDFKVLPAKLAEQVPARHRGPARLAASPSLPWHQDDSAQLLAFSFKCSSASPFCASVSPLQIDRMLKMLSSF